MLIGRYWQKRRLHCGSPDAAEELSSSLDSRTLGKRLSSGEQSVQPRTASDGKTMMLDDDDNRGDKDHNAAKRKQVTR